MAQMNADKNKRVPEAYTELGASPLLRHDLTWRVGYTGGDGRRACFAILVVREVADKRFIPLVAEPMQEPAPCEF